MFSTIAISWQVFSARTVEKVGLGRKIWPLTITHSPKLIFLSFKKTLPSAKARIKWRISVDLAVFFWEKIYPFMRKTY
jgi:hypothetical protein